ncbi:MAG: hypothetical protein IPN70_04280 [Candidatus Moraniibacteriota bacterium]|nr:MAG: hypothetical protein IPN70_04280 [Candidatus Moranbacteria bacterium]
MKIKDETKIIPEKKRKHFFLRGFLISGVIFLVFSAMFHIMAINALATKGYEMRSIESRLEEISEKHKQVHVQEAQLTSLYRIRRIGERLELAYSDISPETVYGVESFAFKSLSFYNTQ